MTALLTKKGTDPDNKTFAEINGVRYTVPSSLKKELDKFQIGKEIEFNETNGILTRIWKPMKTVPVKSANPSGRNERVIAFLALHRDAVQMFQVTENPPCTLEMAADAIFAQAKKDLEKLMEEYGEG